MSDFLKHEPCPNCGPLQDGSGNNLGVYTDGHKWCFACGFYVPSTGVQNLDEVRESFKKRRTQNGIACNLPHDFTTVIPQEPLDWLRQYGITNEEIYKHKFGWSQTFNRLIFPFYDSYGNLLMYQGRWFPTNMERVTNVKRSKYHTEGRPEKIDAYFGDIDQTTGCTDCEGGLVVVVEDVVSALKIARICPALPLFGSELSLDRIMRLAGRFESLLIWLDHDKASYQAKCEIKARPYFKNVSSIFTTHDPKVFTTEELRKTICPV